MTNNTRIYNRFTGYSTEDCRCEVYQDDGYTGLNMERPDLQKMLAAIGQGQFDIVLTKDLSRLGRNYLQTGQLIEEFFPRNKVRYIALNDG